MLGSPLFLLLLIPVLILAIPFLPILIPLWIFQVPTIFIGGWLSDYLQPDQIEEWIRQVPWLASLLETFFKGIGLM